MTPANRLAEAARHIRDDEFPEPGLASLFVALAAFDADAPRREAERAVIAAADAWELNVLGAMNEWGYSHDLAEAVRALRAAKGET